MTYKEAIEKIDSLMVFGSKPGLERITQLLDLMGNPQNMLKFVHVAGTNGKGSVCNMLAHILTESGYKTGLFTSPHITGFGERMQVDFKGIGESEVVDEVERLFPFVEKLNLNGVIITEFEFVTAMAFEWFQRKGCDVVVLETGLGGRFDSTNVIKTPLCSVITSISLDHTAVLGDTLEKIAFEKCGIIKPDGDTVFAFQEDEVNNVIACTAAERNNVLYSPCSMPIISSDITGTVVRYGEADIKIPLVGKHQVKNTALVLTAAEALKKRGCLSIDIESMKRGIEKVKMPARFEVLSQNPLFILDGAHNPGGLEALSNAIDAYLNDKKIICVMGMLKDKDCRNSLAFLKNKIHRLITTTVIESPRRQTAKELAAAASEYFENIIVEEDAIIALNTALQLAEETEDSAVMVCGSLYLASQIRFYLKDNGIFCAE